jgi:hypothetical protein
MLGRARAIEFKIRVDPLARETTRAQVLQQLAGEARRGHNQHPAFRHRGDWLVLFPQTRGPLRIERPDFIEHAQGLSVRPVARSQTTSGERPQSARDLCRRTAFQPLLCLEELVARANELPSDPAGLGEAAAGLRSIPITLQRGYLDHKTTRWTNDRADVLGELPSEPGDPPRP